MLKVLLVEDEDLIRRGLRFKMDWTAVGCVVAGEAASGEEGLEMIRTLQPDVVITDIRMRDMDGLEMIRAGLEVRPFQAVILSGYGEFEYAQRAISLGVSEYLLKPVDFNELRACLQKLVSQRAARERSPLSPALKLSAGGMENKYAARMLEYIQQHYAERISLTDLSQELNISCTHLNAKFKAETGYTFHDFLNHYRIGQAVELQEQGNLKLYEIAEQVGFSDYKYFSKVYKKYVGYPPNKIVPSGDEKISPKEDPL